MERLTAGAGFLALALACAVAMAQSEKAATPPSAVGDSPLYKLPYVPGLDVTAMDRSVDACQDFYQYACGGWRRNNPIPPDQERWSVFTKLAQDNQRLLWGILQRLAAPTASRTSAQQKIGDHFGACMDEAAVERLGAEPLKSHLVAIEGLRSIGDLPALLARLQMATDSDGFFFRFDSAQDFADATKVIAFVMAGGIGLPDRDYYVQDDAQIKKIRSRYEDHVRKTFLLLGDPAEVAIRNSQTVMAIETALARATLTRVDRRDPHKLFHKVDRKGLQALTPGFDWSQFLASSGLDGLDTFNVTEPSFYQALADQWRSLPLSDIKTYLRWHLARAMSPNLSTAFVEEDFDFYSRTLRGVEQIPPRWKRCVALVDSQIGEALGQEYVELIFSPALKAETVRVTRQIEDAMVARIESLDWMTPTTKQRALEKLHSIVNKVGYPEKWRDYAKLDIEAGQYAANVERANIFEVRRRLAKIGKPLDRTEWYMTPPTVNAYYDAQFNDMNFPAGVLQPPLYDPAMDEAPNYGDMGATIGHELTHGFDDQGRQFDGKGDLRDWWTANDNEEFTRRSQCVVDQYAQYTVVDDIKINSKLTLGEDIADLGGTILALIAWQNETSAQKLETRDGLTPAQRFFVGYAQSSCEVNRPESLRLNALTNEHSPNQYRVNGPLSNMPEFEAAFACRPGQPMVAKARCRVW